MAGQSECLRRFGLVEASRLESPLDQRTFYRYKVSGRLRIRSGIQQRPLGHYNREQIANLGYNRWGFKPELGISHTMDRWTLDGAAGVWFFTENGGYFPGYRRKEQSAVISLQGHLSYALPHRMWVAIDGTVFSGGATPVDGAVNPDRQENTRVGTTLSLPIGKVQSLKLAYSTGLRTLRGSDFDNFSVTWQIVRF